MFTASGSRELRAAVIAMKAADRDVKRRITANQREMMNPVWQRAVAEEFTWPTQQAVLNKGVRIASGNPPVLMGANSRRPVGRNRSGRRLIPTSDWQGFEYGAPQEHYSKYQRKNTTNPGTHNVERRTMRHLPPRKRGGYVFGPAVAKVGPRMASLTVQSVVRGYMDILDAKG